MGVYKKKDIKTGNLSKKWWIDYRFNGRRVREPISTNKKEAEKVLHQRLHSINENKHPILRKRKNKKIKFVDFSEKYIKEHATKQGAVRANVQTCRCCDTIIP